jgi:hypothetical protein
LQADPRRPAPRVLLSPPPNFATRRAPPAFPIAAPLPDRSRSRVPASNASFGTIAGIAGITFCARDQFGDGSGTETRPSPRTSTFVVALATPEIVERDQRVLRVCRRHRERRTPARTRR